MKPSFDVHFRGQTAAEQSSDISELPYISHRGFHCSSLGQREFAKIPVASSLHLGGVPFKCLLEVSFRGKGHTDIPHPPPGEWLHTH